MATDVTFTDGMSEKGPLDEASVVPTKIPKEEAAGAPVGDTGKREPSTVMSTEPLARGAVVPVSPKEEASAAQPCASLDTSRGEPKATQAPKTTTVIEKETTKPATERVTSPTVTPTSDSASAANQEMANESSNVASLFEHAEKEREQTVSKAVAVTDDSKKHEPSNAVAPVPSPSAPVPSPPTFERRITSSCFPRQGRVHTPTLKELQSQSFSDYVRWTVLPAVSVYGDDNPVDYLQADTKPTDWTEGMAKVTLPDGFCQLKGIAKDTTARGPAWQTGQPLGDLQVPSPIEQRVRGMAGVYEYTFFDQPATTVAAFRERADRYRNEQLRLKNTKAEEEDFSSDERCEELERMFWKRLGPTMPPAWYGADMEGSLFGDDPASGWSLASLDSCLHVLNKVPGVTSPYLYVGMWASVFCAHTEDMNLLSINYLHAGAPKIWYAVAPGKNAARLEAVMQHYYTEQFRECPEFLRHKRCLVSPKILQKAGIPYTTMVQRPGEAVITFPGGYHWGFNAGFNMAEATNFGVPEWLPYGRRAKVCLCRPDSVRIDVSHVTQLLRKYEGDKQRHPSLTWTKWGRRREEKQRRLESRESAAASAVCSSEQKKRKMRLSEQQKKHEFWIEVMKPAKKEKKAPKEKKISVSDNELGRSQRKRRKSQKLVEAQELVDLAKQKEKQEQERQHEIWHLARPISRKHKVELHTRVLCIVPATVDAGDSNNQEHVPDEQCFRGQVIELADGHVRIRFEGLPKSEDVWLACDSDKLFLDGGPWTESHEEEHQSMIGKNHFWQWDDDVPTML